MLSVKKANDFYNTIKQQTQEQKHNSIKTYNVNICGQDIPVLLLTDEEIQAIDKVLNIYKKLGEISSYDINIDNIRITWRF